MGVAVDRQEIQIILRNAAHRVFNRRADVEKFHVQKHAFATFLFQFIRQRQTAACQHAQTNFIERNAITQTIGKVQALDNIGDI